MPDIHTIRLRHPWKCDVQEGRVRWARSFNWPAGLTPRERVALVIEGLPVGARVTFNGEELVDEFDVTGMIQLHNRITIEYATAQEPEDLSFPCEVRLDIDEG